MTARQTRRHGEERRRLRRRLEAEGVAPAVIERRVDALRRHQEAARPPASRSGNSTRSTTRRGPAHRLDDTGYKPNPGDPLQRGAARVNDITARAARRRNAMTKHEYDRQEMTP